MSKYRGILGTRYEYYSWRFKIWFMMCLDFLPSLIFSTLKLSIAYGRLKAFCFQHGIRTFLFLKPHDLMPSCVSNRIVWYRFVVYQDGSEGETGDSSFNLLGTWVENRPTLLSNSARTYPVSPFLFFAR